MNMKNEAEQLLPYMTSIRHSIHANPELGFEEHKTSALIASELSSMGLQPKLMEPTGVVADIHGDDIYGDDIYGEKRKTLLLRADIDALPILEKTGIEYASKTEGVSHACGHDVHVAMLLGAARLLCEHKKQLAGNVRLLFQPAEETGLGSLKMIEQGVLDGVDACFAEHVLSQFPVGSVMAGSGSVMAGAGTFTITVNGVSSHGAMPEAGADALLAASEIVCALQSIVSRDTAASNPLVITVGTFHSGSRYNVVSGQAILEGTVRAFDRKILTDIGENITRVASGIASAHKCTANIQYKQTCQSLLTDAKLSAMVHNAALDVTGDEKLLITIPPSMGSEDFAWYTPLSPCAYAAIGAGGEHPQHSEFFNIDEKVMVTGAALHLRLALDYLAS